jgi:hypothetical protein
MWNRGKRTTPIRPPTVAAIGLSEDPWERSASPGAREKEPRMMAELTRPDMTAVAIRDATPGDAEQCGRIFAAFESIANRHGFPVEVDSSEFARWKVQALLEDPGFHAFVAERDPPWPPACFSTSARPSLASGSSPSSRRQWTPGPGERS